MTKIYYTLLLLLCMGLSALSANRLTRAVLDAKHKQETIALRDQFYHATQEMAPKVQIQEALQRQRKLANQAQETIIEEYIKVYCGDSHHMSDLEKQQRMILAATLSNLVIKSGVGDVALAEYNKCQKGK